jgi:hypothetical protein
MRLTRAEMSPEHKELERTLLAVVCLPDPNLGALLRRGSVFKGRPLLRRGWRNQCHRNVALEHLASHRRLKVATGYYLSRDGCWRQHSWLWDGEVGRIVETTVPASRYFGVVLDEAETFLFVWDQLSELFRVLGEMTDRVEEMMAGRPMRPGAGHAPAEAGGAGHGRNGG